MTHIQTNVCGVGWPLNTRGLQGPPPQCWDCRCVCHPLLSPSPLPAKLYMWVLGIELRSQYLQFNFVTDQAFTPAPEICFNERTSPQGLWLREDSGRKLQSALRTLLNKLITYWSGNQCSRRWVPSLGVFKFPDDIMIMVPADHSSSKYRCHSQVTYCIITTMQPLKRWQLICSHLWDV